MRRVRAFVLLLVFSSCSAGGIGGQKVQLSVEIKVRHDRSGLSCPVVTGISALPLEAAIGGALTLAGEASSGHELAGWTGEGGDFSAPEQPSTLFICHEPGLHTLSFEVRAARCKPSAASVEVECVAP